MKRNQTTREEQAAFLLGISVACKYLIDVVGVHQGKILRMNFALVTEYLPKIKADCNLLDMGMSILEEIESHESENDDIIVDRSQVM